MNDLSLYVLLRSCIIHNKQYKAWLHIYMCSANISTQFENYRQQYISSQVDFKMLLATIENWHNVVEIEHTK